MKSTFNTSSTSTSSDGRLDEFANLFDSCIELLSSSASPVPSGCRSLHCLPWWSLTVFLRKHTVAVDHGKRSAPASELHGRQRDAQCLENEDPNAYRERITQIISETFNVHVASLSCLCPLQDGHYDGFLWQCTASRYLSLGFGWLCVSMISSERGYSFTSTDEREIGRGVLEYFASLFLMLHRVQIDCRNLDPRVLWRTQHLCRRRMCPLRECFSAKCHSQRPAVMKCDVDIRAIFFRQCRVVKLHHHVREWWVHDKGNWRRWLHPWCIFTCFSVFSFFSGLFRSRCILIFFSLLLSDCDTLPSWCTRVQCSSLSKKKATVYVEELDIFLTMKVLENTPAVLSLGKLCDENGYSYEWINGQKPLLIKDGIRFTCNTENFVLIVVPGLSSSSSGSSSTSRTPMKQESHSSSSSLSSSSSPTVSEIQIREREDATNSDISPVMDRGNLMEIQANEIPKTNQKETPIERWNLCDHSEIPEWLQEFRKILVDDEIPLQGASHVSSSHEVSLEPTTKRREDLGKHNVHIHFLKDRNCEICKRTKITRAPCWRRIGRVVLRAVNFGDLMTADHKVLSDNCESRNNHRYAVVVQDLATQWIQAFPCKNKTSQETQRSLQKFLETERNPKVIYTDNSLEFGKICEDLCWNHCTSTAHRSETNGIAERAVRRVCSQVWMKNGG